MKKEHKSKVFEDICTRVSHNFGLLRRFIPDGMTYISGILSTYGTIYNTYCRR